MPRSLFGLFLLGASALLALCPPLCSAQDLNILRGSIVNQPAQSGIDGQALVPSLPSNYLNDEKPRSGAVEARDDISNAWVLGSFAILFVIGVAIVGVSIYAQTSRSKPKGIVVCR